jgi:hypothetical protein
MKRETLRQRVTLVARVGRVNADLEFRIRGKRPMPLMVNSVEQILGANRFELLDRFYPIHPHPSRILPGADSIHSRFVQH